MTEPSSNHIEDLKFSGIIIFIALESILLYRLTQANGASLGLCLSFVNLAEDVGMVSLASIMLLRCS